MKIVWPYDPFFKSSKLNVIGRKIILNYFKKDPIEAVYVATNSEAELATAYDIPLDERFSLYPKKIIKSQLRKLDLKNLTYEVVTSMSLSLTKAVTALIVHAKAENADLILLASNDQNPLPAIVFGSFAETLLHLSPIDLLIYHQKTKFSSKQPHRILYAHDHTPKGYAGLLKLITFATKWDATIFVVHIPTADADQSDEEYVQNVERKSNKSKLLLNERNVKHKIVNIYDDAKKDKIILKFAKKQKIDLIAMTAQSNKLQVLLGGSLTRKVLRQSTLPVIIIKI